MRIVADENISYVDKFFGSIGELETFPGRAITPELVAGADILLVRSVTAVNADLLKGSKVRCVGTATSGLDHIDQTYLSDEGIQFFHAQGSNAQAVVDYVLAAMAYHFQNETNGFLDQTVGIIGAGNVGGLLRKTLESMGINCLVCDPPLKGLGQEGLCDLDEALSADIITLHCPLTETGSHPTKQLVDDSRIEQWVAKGGSLLINAARGGVVADDSLFTQLSTQPQVSAALDVWQEEPLVPQEGLQQVELATPHIAGYSLEAKLRGTQMLYESVCDWLGVEAEMHYAGLLPPQKTITLELQGDSIGQQLCEIILAGYNPEEDDQNLRQALDGLTGEARKQAFDHCRRDYAHRRELKSLGYRIKSRISNQTAELMSLIENMGLKLDLE